MKIGEDYINEMILILRRLVAWDSLLDTCDTMEPDDLLCDIVRDSKWILAKIFPSEDST